MSTLNFDSKQDFINQTTSRGNQNKLQLGSYWYKFDTNGYEGLTEYIISRILLKNKVNCVKYDLVQANISGELRNGVKSLNFKSPEQEVVTLGKLFTAYGYSLTSKEYNRLSTLDKIEYVLDKVNTITHINCFGEYLANLLYIDRIFLNEDRHFNNIAFLYDSLIKTYSLPPIFDNGASLLSDTKDYYPLGESIYRLLRKVKAKPFNVDFMQQCAAMDTFYRPSITIEYSIDEILDMVYSTQYSERIKERVCNILRLQHKYVEHTGATNLF